MLNFLKGIQILESTGPNSAVQLLTKLKDTFRNQMIAKVHQAIRKTSSPANLVNEKIDKGFLIIFD